MENHPAWLLLTLQHTTNQHPQGHYQIATRKNRLFKKSEYPSWTAFLHSFFAFLLTGFSFYLPPWPPPWPPYNCGEPETPCLAPPFSLLCGEGFCFCSSFGSVILLKQSSRQTSRGEYMSSVGILHKWGVRGFKRLWTAGGERNQVG